LNALEYAEENLFGPLGITDVDWPADPQGVTVGFSELRMHPQDMAKIGYLYLNEGEWDGEQVVSSEWVAASSQEHISATLADGYGYQWWVEDSGIYLALGYRGQFIYVMPGMDLVVVFTSTLPDYDFYVPRALLDDYVIPAVLSDGALPANPDGTALLEYRIEALAEP
jgi:CubicO group peptidase (beta-lactamase class C family)